MDGILACHLHKCLLKCQFCVPVTRDNADCISGVSCYRFGKIAVGSVLLGLGCALDVESFQKYHCLDPFPKDSNLGPGLSLGTFKSSVDLDVKPRLTSLL